MLLIPTIKNKTLDEVSKPYLGAYECTRATIGSKDCLDDFSDIQLELKDEKNFVLVYQKKDGEKKRIKGKYSYDKKRGVVTFTAKGGVIKREFPLVDGQLTVTFPLQGKTMVLQFQQK